MFEKHASVKYVSLPRKEETGEIKGFEVGDLVSRKMARRLDRSIKFSLVAGKKALMDAGLPLSIKCAHG